MKKNILILLYFILIRILFVKLSGYNSYELSADSHWINDLSEKVLTGDFDFDIGRFIVAPFYNIYIALHKLVFGDHWMIALVSSQIILSGISGVYFYKLGKLLFKEKTALLATGIFGVFPLTLWWVHTFSSEALFQSLFIISIYFLVKLIKFGKLSSLITSAIIFSIAFLTKSHILLFTPFLAYYIFINLKGTKKWGYPIVYALICILFTIPFGLYNQKHHNQYVLSSNGSKFHFYTGNSEYGYRLIVDIPKQGTLEFNEVTKMNMAYFNGATHNKTMKLPHIIKQDLYFQHALDWISVNKIKFLKIKIYNLFQFLMPGVNYKYYQFLTWLATLIISLPIYILGYFSIIKNLKRGYKTHYFILGLFITMILFSVIWYTQNRFRTITIEPFYILYSSHGIMLIYNRLLKKRKIY